jgi:cellulose synthase/poly-beta-1,6-N-acetylglucosamine synthase-like glycosyltransferase
MSEAAEAAFWGSVLGLVYAYAGFPVLVIAVGTVMRRKVARGSLTPTVSLIVAAYNEEREIANRIRNALQMDYPPEKLEIIIASDGSTDKTEPIVRGFASERVRLLVLQRQGKIPALDAAVNSARGEILVFSDANSAVCPDGLRKLVAPFADPHVGGVAGNTRYQVALGSQSSGHNESLYLSYDSWLKQRESFTGSVVSAQGGLYAIRRRLYRRPEDTAVTDDFAISTAVIEQGFRLVFEPEAISVELAIPSAEQEFRRRIRLMTRGFRSVALRWRLLNPMRYGFYSVVLFSHKIVRRLAPLLVLPLFASSLLLASHSAAFAAFAALQLTFYALAFAGYLLRHSALGRTKCFSLPFYYCMANTAAVIALGQFVSGRRIGIWEPQRNRA